MRRNLPCLHCGQVTHEINAQIHSGVRDLRAQLCLTCYDLADVRAEVARAFLAGEFGDDARMVWYHELPDGGVQVFKADRAHIKPNGRSLARFIADLPG